MKDHYSQMGVRKFSFFLTVSLVCLIPAGVLAAGSWGKDCAAKVFLRMHKPESDAKTQTGVQAQAHPAARSLSNLDIAMLCYTGCSWARIAIQSRYTDIFPCTLIKTAFKKIR